MTHDVLPVHPFTGLTAIGVLPSGRPVWPVIGAAPDDGEGGDDQDDDAGAGGTDDDAPGGDDAGDDEDKPLGPAGEKALAAEKERRRTEQARRRAAEKKVADLEAQMAQTRKAVKPSAQDGGGDSGDDKVDPEEIRRQAREEMQAEAARERVLDKIEVKAAKSFADPADAAALLLRDHDIEDFLDGGKPDVEAIQDALGELLKKKPYLGATAQGGKRFQGTADGGAKPVTPARPKSLGEAVARALAPK